MELERFAIEGLLLIKPRVFEDNRGFFLETFNKNKFDEAGIPSHFVQDNHSCSQKNTVRGLHYQVNRVQAKLVRCTRGVLLDVAVDIRPDSPTYGQWQSVVLSEANKHSFFVPGGFAHGFSVLSDTAELQYKCSNFYSPQDERGLLWNDPALAIDWRLDGEPILSEKDTKYPTFENILLS